MWKNIKSLFVLEEETAPGKEEATPRQPSARGRAPEAAGQSSPKGKATKQFTEVLLRAMSNQNIEGFDYLEYKRSLNSLKEMPMDEPTRYRSAFAMAQTMGTTPEHLMQTARHYIAALEKEEQKFQEALSNQKKLKVESKEQQILKLDDTVKKKAEQIRRLTQEIETHQKEKAELQKEAEEAVGKLESTRLDFLASFESLVGQIHRDVEHMDKYLVRKE